MVSSPLGVNRAGRGCLVADGVGPESLVALGMRRSLDLVVGMHAVLAAGWCVMCPIDPDHPRRGARRTFWTGARPVCVC